MSCVVGLRVDVDTMRGLRVGVPALLALLAKHEVQASFFVSVGPDTMGRHVWRLLKPKFLWKMLRSNAAGLYGWDILCSGTLWPGVVMGRRQPDVIRAIGAAGHELGLHAWDHYRWQTRVARFSEDEAGREMQRGFDMLAGITGERPRVSAMPGWRCTEAALLAQARFGFAYSSDCRGDAPFVAVVAGKPAGIQLPVNLPTYDEVIGRDGISAAQYNAHLLGMMKADTYQLYTIHAEVEGGSQLALFDAMLREAKQRGIRFVPLRDIAGALDVALLPQCTLGRGTVAGREGWVAVKGA